MMKYLISTFVLWALLTSCSAEHSFPGTEEGTDNVLSFEASKAAVWDMTKADENNTDITNENISTMSVFGYYTGETAWGTIETDSIPVASVLFNRQQVTRTGDVWTYSPPEYWRVSGKHHFFAFAPYGKIRTEQPLPVKGPPTPILQIPARAIEQFDYLWSTGNTLNLTRANHASTPVHFQFQHALTKIHFAAKITPEFANAQVTAGNDSVKIILIELQNVTDEGSPRFTYNADTTVVTGGRWEIYDRSKVVDFTAQENQPGDEGSIKQNLYLAADSFQSVLRPEGYFYMLPQRIDTAVIYDNLSVTPRINLHFKSKSNGKILVVSKDLPAPSVSYGGVMQQRWLPGQSILYTITYNGEGKNPFYVEAVVTPWDSQDVNANLQGTYLHVSEIKKIYTAEATEADRTIYYETDYPVTVSLYSAIGGGGVSHVPAEKKIILPASANPGTYIVTIEAGKLRRDISVKVI